MQLFHPVPTYSKVEDGAEGLLAQHIAGFRGLCAPSQLYPARRTSCASPRPPSATRSRRLKRRLGKALFRRTTRGIVLSDEGAVLAPVVREALARDRRGAGGGERRRRARSGDRGRGRDFRRGLPARTAAALPCAAPRDRRPRADQQQRGRSVDREPRLRDPLSATGRGTGSRRMMLVEAPLAPMCALRPSPPNSGPRLTSPASRCCAAIARATGRPGSPPPAAPEIAATRPGVRRVLPDGARGDARTRRRAAAGADVPARSRSAGSWSSPSPPPPGPAILLADPPRLCATPGTGLETVPRLAESGMRRLSALSRPAASARAEVIASRTVFRSWQAYSKIR